MSYNSGSNRSRNFKSAPRFALVRFWNYSRDYSLNCTPLGPITITNNIRNWPLPMGAFQDQCKQIVINKHNLVKNPNWRESSMSANALISERTGRYTVADLKALEYGSQLEHWTDKPATTKMAALQYSKPWSCKYSQTLCTSWNIKDLPHPVGGTANASSRLTKWSKAVKPLLEPGLTPIFL